MNPILGLPTWDAPKVSLQLKQPKAIKKHLVVKPLNPSSKTTRDTSLFPHRSAKVSLPKKKDPSTSFQPMNPKPGVPYVASIPVQKPKVVPPKPKLIEPIRYIPVPDHTRIIQRPQKPSPSPLKILRDTVDTLDLPYCKKGISRDMRAYLNNIYLNNVSQGVCNNGLNVTSRDEFSVISFLVNQECSFPSDLTLYQIPHTSELCIVAKVDKLKLLAQEKTIVLPRSFQLDTYLGKPFMIQVPLENCRGAVIKGLIGLPDKFGNLIVPYDRQKKVFSIKRQSIESQNRLHRLNYTSNHIIPPLSLVKPNCAVSEVFTILQVNFPNVKFIWASSQSKEWETDYLSSILTEVSSLPSKISLSFLLTDKDSSSAQLSLVKLPGCINLIPLYETECPEVLQYRDQSICVSCVYPLRSIPLTNLPILLPSNIEAWKSVVNHY
jgi:hypothetical protein